MSNHANFSNGEHKSVLSYFRQRIIFKKQIIHHLEKQFYILFKQTKQKPHKPRWK